MDLERKLLRDEVARLTAVIRTFESDKKEMQSRIDQMEARNAEMAVELEAARRIISYYNNSHSPPSQNSFPAQRRKRDKKIPDGTPHKKPGGKEGHVGTSHNNKADETVEIMPDGCGTCGGGDIIVVHTDTKLVSDMKEVPKVVTTGYVLRTVMCNDCGSTTSPERPGIEGTSFGSITAAFIVSLYDKGCSISSIRETLRFIGIRVSKSTVQNALVAVSKKLEPVAEEIVKDVAGAEYVLMDETPFDMTERQGYVWACTGGDAVQVEAEQSRGSIVLDMHFPYYEKAIVCDGYAVYRAFPVMQRCWSHILREAEDLADTPRGRTLHEKLQMLLHDAKLAPPDKNTHDGLVIRAKSIAATYAESGYKFGTTLENAADCLFTFVMHPGMPPTNNESERSLRRVVIQRKIRQRMVTVGGRKMFGILMTCLLTWRKRGLDVADQMLDVLGAT